MGLSSLLVASLTWRLALSVWMSVSIAGAADCPTEAAVVGRLRTLLGRPPAPGLDRAVVVARDGGLEVQLHRADGTVIGMRHLAAAGDCDQRAEAVAVTLASWESELAGSGSPALELPSLRAPLAVSAAHRPPPRLSWEVEAAFLGSIAGEAFAPGASIGVTLGKRRFPLAARLGLAGMDTRDVALSEGRGSFSRWALVLGPTFEALSKVVRLELHADLLAGWVFIQGNGFTTNRSANAFDPALGGGARLSFDRWKVSPFLDLTFVGWLRRQTLSVDQGGAMVSAEIPRFDVWLRAGIAYGRNHGP